MIPHFGDTYDAEALFSPEDAVSAQGDELPDVPPAVILGYQDELHDAVQERTDEPITIVRSQRLYPLSKSVGFVPVNESGIGAPVSAIITDNVLAAGAEVVVMLGGCAALQTEFEPDAALLPTRTVRDEGVSHHYLPPDEPVTATPELVDVIDDSFTAANFDTHRGPTWTTSAVYRETVPQIEHYKEEGFVSLCMESAAIWAVCQYRGADAATIHEIGDYLTPNEWTPEVEKEGGLPAMLPPAVAALEAYVVRKSFRE